MPSWRPHRNSLLLRRQPIQHRLLATGLDVPVVTRPHELFPALERPVQGE
jgi:hypothetical protein